MRATCDGRRRTAASTPNKSGLPSALRGTSDAGGRSCRAVSAIERSTMNGMPSAVATRATISLSRSTARAWVVAQARFFSVCVARMDVAPNTSPSTAPIDRANWLNRQLTDGSIAQRWVPETTSPETTTVPTLSSGASPPAMPKLTRQSVFAAAVATSVAVRSRSPVPMTTENPAACAIVASTARPEMHPTLGPIPSCVLVTLNDRSETEFDPARVFRRQAAIAGEGPEREEGAVSVITQIKDSWKADSRKPGLLPISLLILVGDQIGDAAGDCRVFDLPRCHQTEQGPGRLRRGTVRHVAVGRIGKIGFAAFSPAAVSVLAGNQPVDCPLYLQRRRLGADGVKSREH